MIPTAQGFKIFLFIKRVAQNCAPAFSRSHRFVACSSLGASPGFAVLAGRGCAARRVLSRGRSCGSRDILGSSPSVPMAVKSGSLVGLASVRDAVPQHPLRRHDLPPWLHRPQKRARPTDDFPSLEEGDAFHRRSLLVSKTIANFARYLERRPAGVVSAGDGS